MLHVAILRSPIAHGRLRGLDPTAARAIPGVCAFITAAEIGTVPRIPLGLLPLPRTERFLQPVIVADSVRYVGEPIAVVLADSAALAEDGVGAIALDIEELPPNADRRASGQHDILLFEESGTNLAVNFTATAGDAEAAFRDADYVRRERFQVQRYTVLPIEYVSAWKIDPVEGLSASNFDPLCAKKGLTPRPSRASLASCSPPKAAKLE